MLDQVQGDEIMNKIKWKGFLLTTSDSEIEVIHDTLTYDWGQKVFRFYDYDKHIVEVSESIQGVFNRLYAQGLSLPKIAERFGEPLEIVKERYSIS